MIVSSDACLEEMREFADGPKDPRGHIRFDWRNFGDAGRFFNEVMWTRFSAEGFIQTLPSRTFSGEQTIHVGAKEVRFIEVGPAHTKGDVIVHLPDDRVVFAGDIVFIGGHPVIWSGPIGNWIDACDLMLGWDVDIVVPGHGPITDKRGIHGLKDYLLFVETESRKRFDAGMGWEAAGRDIDLGAFADWIDRERIVMNVFSCYREFAGETGEFDRIEVIGAAGRYFFDRREGRL